MAYSKYKGFYKPLKPEKWKGNINNIVFRSMLEYKFFRALELNENVLEISSEEIIIPYVSPLDGKIHRYYPDLLLKVKTKNGKIKTYLCEIKPATETKPPRKTKRISESKYYKRVNTYLINEAKWKYAKKYAEKNGWEFVILTEKDL